MDRKIEIENIGRECVWGVCEYIHKGKKNVFLLDKIYNLDKYMTDTVVTQKKSKKKCDTLLLFQR